MTSPIEPLPPPKLPEKNYWWLLPWALPTFLIGWSLFNTNDDFYYETLFFCCLVSAIYVSVILGIWFFQNGPDLAKFFDFLFIKNIAKRDRIKKAELFSKRLSEGENIAKSPIIEWLFTVVLIGAVLFLMVQRGGGMGRT